MDSNVVVKRIEMRLSEIGMQKSVFYQRTGITSATLSQWRNGKYIPSEKKLSVAAECLGVSVDWLKGDENEKEKLTDISGSELREVIETYIERPDMQAIFHSTRELTSEEIDAVLQMIKIMKHK